jgi:hypothetical protein
LLDEAILINILIIFNIFIDVYTNLLNRVKIIFYISFIKI